MELNYINISCPLQGKDETRLALINLVTSVFSIIGSGSIIFYTVYKRVFRSSEIRPLFHLSLADYLLSSFWLCTSVYFLHESERLSKSGDIECFCLEVITEMCHYITFFLTVNYAVHVYIKVREGAHQLSNLVFTVVSTDVFYQRLFCILFICSWIFPVLLQTPLLVQAAKHPDKMQQCFWCARCRLLFDRPQMCIDQKNGHTYNYSIYLMISTLSLCIIVLAVLYYRTWVNYRRSRMRMAVITHNQHVQIRAMRNRIGWFIAAFLVCWMPALCVVVATALCQNKPIPIALRVLQSLTAPMQGFLNCLVYGWTRKNFHKAVEAGQNEILSSYYRYDDIDSLYSSVQSDLSN